MMGHTTLNVFTTTHIYKYTNTHKYRNTQRKEMSHYSQCNVFQLSLHPTLQCEHCILLGAKSNCWWLYSPGDVWGKSPRLNAVSRCYVLPSSRRCIAYLLLLARHCARVTHQVRSELAVWATVRSIWRSHLEWRFLPRPTIDSFLPSCAQCLRAILHFSILSFICFLVVYTFSYFRGFCLGYRYLVWPKNVVGPQMIMHNITKSTGYRPRSLATQRVDIAW